MVSKLQIYFLYTLRIEILFITIVLFVLSSCQKKEDSVEAPEVTFLNMNSVYCDTSLMMGSNMKFIIKASGSEAFPITNLVVKSGSGVFLDSGLYSSDFVYELNITKGNAASETWSFFVMNKARQSKTIQVTITLSDSSDFNPVDTYTQVRIGAQSHTSIGSFWSPADNTVHFLSSACQIQEAIHFIYYYGTGALAVNECTLSSPNDNDVPSVFTGPCGLAEWNVRNESRYLLTSLNEQDFNQVSNDSLLIASYDPILAKRKGKNAAPGQVWSFRFQNGKLGLMYIHESIHGVDGSLLFSVKIQQ